MAAPAKLKAIQPYLKLAKDYDKRDAVISYYCRMYAVQKGISIDSKSPDCKGFLLDLMDSLEKLKKTLSDGGDESVSNELVGCAHVESRALKVFSWADAEDRKANFNTGVVRAFYSANLLFDVVKQFGAQSDEVSIKQKYAKWKATYINKCLQTGETPIPGPQGTEFEDELSGLESTSEGASSLPYPAASGSPFYPPSTPSQPPPQYTQPPQPHSNQPSNVSQPFGASRPSGYDNTSKDHSSSYQDSSSASSASSSSYSVPIDYTQATKYCKYAISSLQYEDVTTAIDNLEKALALLKTQK